MPFSLPEYIPPDFTAHPLSEAPVVAFKPVEKDGVAPAGYHATSIFPEYFQVHKGDWRLPPESRMDCTAVLEADGSIEIKEFRRLRLGDRVALGRGENGEDGIYVHSAPFPFFGNSTDKFAFRMRTTRETSFSIDYDELYGLLRFERENGFILWVLGPAVAFDRDARNALTALIDHGFMHGLLAGNALAVHDVEASLTGTALGQEIYTKRHVRLGHYMHLDAINTVRDLGSLFEAVESGLVTDGVMRSVILRDIPFVLAGSIRDDGPLPEVISDVYVAQDRMRLLARRATTVIAMATQLHSIAAGNMIPAYNTTQQGLIRPVYFYNVDMTEFATNKLADRGSLTARSILTNAQDFVVNLERGLVGR